MTENVVGKANVRLIYSIFVELNYDDLTGGTVFVYKIKSDSDDLFFDNFYIATFDDQEDNIVWGVGPTPLDALKNAEREWDRYCNEEEGECSNPFRETLEKLGDMQIEDTYSGKVTVKEVLNVPVKDGSVFVYEIEDDEGELFSCEFYIATFDNLRNKIVWGVGATPLDALEDAERNWDRLGDEFPNPFREALEKLIEEGNNMLLNY